MTTDVFKQQLEPAWRRLVVLGATTDERLAAVGRELAGALPRTERVLLRPAGREGPGPGGYGAIVDGSSESIAEADLARLPACDAVVLALSHVTRAAYKPLVRACRALTKNAFLFSNFGLQPLDARDASTDWPAPVPPADPSQKQDPRAWLFFRPSDQTVHRMAEELACDGKQVWRVDTLAAFEALVPRADAAFFDWCVTDYGALFEAAAMAGAGRLRREAFLALDLADLAEDRAVAERLTALNRSALPQFDRVYPLLSRQFLAERYGLAADRWSPKSNVPDPAVWRPVPRPPRDGLAPIHLVYHGLFYYWHELAPFVPVVRALAERGPIRFDLFGRVHESVRVGDRNLFPARERQVRDTLRELAGIPGVTSHGFTAPDRVRETIGRADYYVGITAGETLMSRTEFRTGVAEALAAGGRLVHKETEGLLTAGLAPGTDYLAVDSLQAEAAAERMLEQRGAGSA